MQENVNDVRGAFNFREENMKQRRPSNFRVTKLASRLQEITKNSRSHV